MASASGANPRRFAADMVRRRRARLPARVESIQDASRHPLGDIRIGTDLRTDCVLCCANQGKLHLETTWPRGWILGSGSVSRLG